MLYVDKSVEIELREGAVLKLAPEVCRVEPEGEITTDQDAGKKLDDLEIGGVFDYLATSSGRAGVVWGNDLHDHD